MKCKIIKSMIPLILTVSFAITAQAECVQSGPYGTISIDIPNGWEACGMPLDDANGERQYGLRIYRPETPDSWVDVVYYSNFGVCGTGLEQEEVKLAGCKAYVGYYNDTSDWNFVIFDDDNSGIVALPSVMDEDSDIYSEGLFDILDTVKFDRDIKVGGAYYYTEESDAVEIYLQMLLKHISSSGATVVFQQWFEEENLGELCFGSYFRLEKYDEIAEEWEQLDTVYEEIGFTDEEYVIEPNAMTEYECNWKAYYGELLPGTYRLVKTVNSFSQTGEKTEYELGACFVWSGEVDEEDHLAVKK